MEGLLFIPSLVSVFQWSGWTIFFMTQSIWYSDVWTLKFRAESETLVGMPLLLIYVKLSLFRRKKNIAFFLLEQTFSPQSIGPLSDQIIRMLTMCIYYYSIPQKVKGLLLCIFNTIFDFRGFDVDLPEIPTYILELEPLD